MPRKKASSAARGPGPPLRRERGADHDVRQMPRGVRRMQQRHVVAPAAGCERVERRPRDVVHARRPQTTMPPPRLSLVRARRIARVAPELAQASSGSGGRSRGCSGRGTPDLGPAGRDHPPGGGETHPDVESHSGRHGPRGRANSSIAIVPPGRTTRVELAQRVGRVVHVAQQIRERERVERRLERQLLGASLDELDTVAAARRRASASISGLWSIPTTRQPVLRRTSLGRDRARSRRDVEHRSAAGPRRSARRGNGASGDPGRTTAATRSGRTSGRAGRTACAR